MTTVHSQAEFDQAYTAGVRRFVIAEGVEVTHTGEASIHVSGPGRANTTRGPIAGSVGTTVAAVVEVRR